MAQVPYQPFPTAQPGYSAPPEAGERINVTTPPAAFGENIGAAVQQLGTTVSHVGDELFGRALALQELRNEADAREAQSNYAEKSAPIQARFDALEGKAKVEALQGHIQSLKTLRTQIRSGLGTANAQRMFDADTMPFTQRLIFTSAGQAGEANKKWLVGTAESAKQVAIGTYADPKSDTEFADKIREVDQQDAKINDIANDGRAAERKLNSHSALWVGRIEALAKDDPQAALNMIDSVRGNPDIKQEDLRRMEAYARQQNRGAGAAALSRDVFSFDKSATEMEAEVRKRAAALAHGDPLFEQDAVKQLRSDIANNRYFQQQDQNSAMQSIYEAIHSGNVTNMQQLLAQPEMDSTIARLSDKQKALLPSVVHGTVMKMTLEERNDTFTRLWGLANSGDQRDKEEFLDTNLRGQGLDNSQIDRLQTKRGQLLKNAGDDPHFGTVSGWMKVSRGAELKALGLLRGADNFDKDSFDKYQGALAIAIDAWRQDNGKPPSFEDVRDKIGPSVLRTVGPQPGFFGRLFGGQSAHAFEPDEAAVKKWATDNNFIDEVRSRTGQEPSDEETTRAYMRDQFMKLYSTGNAGAGSNVPRPNRP